MVDLETFQRHLWGIFRHLWRCLKMPKCLSLMVYRNAYKFFCRNLQNFWRRCLSTNGSVEIYRTFGEDAWKCLKMPVLPNFSVASIQNVREAPRTSGIIDTFLRRHWSTKTFQRCLLYLVSSRGLFKDKEVWQAKKFGLRHMYSSIKVDLIW